MDFPFSLVELRIYYHSSEIDFLVEYIDSFQYFHRTIVVIPIIPRRRWSLSWTLIDEEINLSRFIKFTG